MAMPTLDQVRTIGVIGAGQMGSGIAHVAALAGFQVRLQDIKTEQLDKALAGIGSNMDRQVKKGSLDSEGKAAALARIQTSVEVAAFADCDLVIEAATENYDLKLKILRGLVPHLKAEALIATNTSSLSITGLAAATDRPERFMGMHFMNPVPVMKLVELIRGIQTSVETDALIRAIAEKMGKTVILAQDLPGFAVNRILMPMINEAIFALYEGIASTSDIDQGMILGTNQPMGPLTLADFIGLDTCLEVMHVLHRGFSDSKYRPCPLLTRLVEAGWLGRKTGKGFYDYSQTPPVPVRLTR